MLLAFVVAVFFTWLDLITTKYPRTCSLLWRCWQLWIYCLMYGVVAAAVCWCWAPLEAAGKVSITEAVFKSPWFHAAMVGLSARAFLHINLCSTQSGGKAMPVGIETLVMPIEAPLLRGITSYEFEAVEAFVAPMALKYTDPDDVKARIIAKIPPALPPAEIGAFKDDMSKATKVNEALAKGLAFLGKSPMRAAFP